MWEYHITSLLSPQVSNRCNPTFKWLQKVTQFEGGKRLLDRPDLWQHRGHLDGEREEQMGSDSNRCRRNHNVRRYMSIYWGSQSMVPKPAPRRYQRNWGRREGGREKGRRKGVWNSQTPNKTCSQNLQGWEQSLSRSFFANISKLLRQTI